MESIQKEINEHKLIILKLVEENKELKKKNDIILEMVKKYGKMIEILKEKNLLARQELSSIHDELKNESDELNNKLIDHKTNIENFKSYLQKEFNQLHQKNETQEKEIRKLNSKINLFSYRNSVKRLLDKLLNDSDSKLKYETKYTYKDMREALDQFIKSQKFGEKYFIDKNGTFLNFISKLCNFMDSCNSKLHERKANYQYSFEDFICSFNMCCDDYGIEKIIQQEEIELIDILKKYQMYDYFI